MPTPDETQNPGEDSTPDSPESSRPEAGGEGAPTKDERPVRDLGSLAIGGTIGGIVAAKALKGAMGTGAKSIAAGYLAKRLREAQGATNAESEVSQPAPPPEQESPSSSLPPAIPDSELPAAPVEVPPQPVAIPTSPPAETAVQTQAALPGELAAPSGDDTVEEEADELLEASPESQLPASPADEQRDLGVEALEAEDELEEALMLMGDGGPASSDTNSGGRLGQDQASEETDSPSVAATPAGAVRSPFMRDHSPVDKPASREDSKDGNTDQGPGPSGDSRSPAEPVLAGSGEQQATAAEPTPPPPTSNTPAPPAMDTPGALPTGLMPATPGAPSGLEGGTPLEGGAPLDAGALLEGGTPLIPVAPLPAPDLPPPPASPIPSPPSQPAESALPSTQLPGLAAPTELPKPASHLPPARSEVPPPPESLPEAPQVSSFVPSPAESGSVLPPAGSTLSFEPPAAATVPPAPPELTEVPLQPAPEAPPLPQIPVQAQAPAAPLRDMMPAPRPELTKAEIAAKERADKMAKKKEAKKKGKKKGKPAKAKKEKKVSAAKSEPKPKAKKPKSSKTGAKSRLLLVGLPILLVLGGAGGFAYMNKDKFGFGGAVTPGDSTNIPTVPVGEVTSKVDDEPVISENIFETPGHVLPGDTDPRTGGGTDTSPIEEPPAALQFTDQELKEIVLDPRKTLEAFLLAGTVDDLLNFVADPEQVSQEIRQFYKGGKRTPIAGEIRFDRSGLVPETNLAAYQYWVTSSRREIPVSVEETEQGYRVDWAAFTQFHEAKFEKFLRDTKNPGGEFYVQLRRSHYFGNDLADVDDWYAFRIQSPIAPFAEGFAFLRKTNPEAKAILERYRWSKGYRPYVELGWFTPKGGEPRIELKRITRPTWRR